jgi:hypothetical protein
LVNTDVNFINITRAFEMAKDEGALLQIDEADSFLYDRTIAKNLGK